MKKRKSDRESEDSQESQDLESQSPGSVGVPHAPEGSQDVPPLATVVNTVDEAVNLSLKNGFSEHSLFTFCRALKSFQLTTKIKLDTVGLEGAFGHWWQQAKQSKPKLPLDADWEEFLLVFLDTYDHTRYALGANVIAAAIERAATTPPPPAADRYASPNLKRLVALCFHLQLLNGDAPFFLSLRDAAKFLNVSTYTVAAFLAGFERAQILTLVEKGKPGGRTASRFKFNFAANNPTPPSESAGIAP